MKTYNKLILILAVLGLFSSCKKFVEGYEKNPTGIDYTVVDQEMTAVMLENQFFQKADGLRIAMMWLNQATGSDRQYVTLDDWNKASGSDFNGPWNEVYIAMTHADIVEKQADADGNIILRGLAKLYKAWAGGEAASLWGDVPFSQLNQYELYPDPAYEHQGDVLDQVQDLLDEAIADLNSGVGQINADRDFYFGGNTSKWVKIAHGLKARFYLHRHQPQAYVLALAEALQGPSDVSDDLYAQYDSNDDTPYSKWNPTKQFLESRSGYLDASEAWARTKLLNGLRNNAKTKDYRKAYNYAGDGLNAASGATGTGKFFGDMPMVTYGEMLLIATEAELRQHPDATGINNALTHYNNYRSLLAAGEYMGGYINSHMKYDSYDATDFDAGGIENQDNIDPVQAFFREIFEERYIFFIGDYESFIDFARSFNDPMVPEYMKLHYNSNGPLYSGQPLRFIYPQVEKDANANFPGMVDVNEALPLYQ